MGGSFYQIEEMEYWRWMSLFEYWQEHPPMKEIVRAYVGVGHYRKDKSGKSVDSGVAKRPSEKSKSDAETAAFFAAMGVKMPSADAIEKKKAKAAAQTVK